MKDEKEDIEEGIHGEAKVKRNKALPLAEPRGPGRQDARVREDSLRNVDYWNILSLKYPRCSSSSGIGPAETLILYLSFSEGGKISAIS